MSELKNWEHQQFNWLKQYLYPEDQTEEQTKARNDVLVYLGTGRLGDLVPEGTDPPEGAEDEEVTEWTMGRYIGRVHFKTKKEDDWTELDLAEGEDGRKGQHYQNRYYMRTGNPTRIWLAHAALYIEELQAGRRNRDQDAAREELLGYVEDARDNMPFLQLQRDPEDGFDKDRALDITKEMRGRFMQISERLRDGETRTELYIQDSNVFEAASAEGRALRAATGTVPVSLRAGNGPC